MEVRKPVIKSFPSGGTAARTLSGNNNHSIGAVLRKCPQKISTHHAENEQAVSFVWAKHFGHPSLGWGPKMPGTVRCSSCVNNVQEFQVEFNIPITLAKEN
jgi:hypothetical protein